jgi:hypothetical protein
VRGRHALGISADETVLVKHILHGVRGFGPYLLVELLLPGGSLIALLMWLFKRHSEKEALRAEKSLRLSASDPNALSGSAACASC